jgi:hypothetical protein
MEKMKLLWCQKNAAKVAAEIADKQVSCWRMLHLIP